MHKPNGKIGNKIMLLCRYIALYVMCFSNGTIKDSFSALAL